MRRPIPALIVLGLTLLAVGCADAPVDDGEPGASDLEVIRAKSGGTTYMLHVGGVCSTSFTVGKKGENGARIGQWDGITSVDLSVDQTGSMSVAVPQMIDHLDTYCTGADECLIYTYSNGGAVVSKAIALTESGRWNILWVLNAASNVGGSEIADNFLAAPLTALGFRCDLADEIGPSDFRNAWNHNDTDGATFYMLPGNKEWWYTGRVPDFFGGSANDGAVAYHSSAGLNDTYHVSDDDPWACYEATYHYENHVPAFTCEGLDLDHNEMISAGIDQLGG